MLAATLLAAALMTQGDTGRRIAITFDDLPLSRAATPVAAQESLTVALVAALTAARVPAIGFVNEGKLRGDDRAVDPRRVALLTRWLDAGLELGNHTATHPDLHQVPLADVEADLLAGEAILRPLLAARGATPRYFRHPYLHTGRSLAVRDALLAFLEAHGYEVAPVTMDNGDYLFARAYDLARDRGDRAAADRITAEYLAYLERVVVFWERQSVAITGREIPQVLLLHANALNAATFPRIAGLLAGRGYTAIPLAQALADPVYRSDDRYTGPAGMSWLHRWAITRGLPGSTFRGEPEVPEWVQAAAR
ncbi:MAG: polysaccharide deacetylase family protein [Gemmatimonadetes bacterium]|nr:polysaccharide deacetylase family protein [Gemmatimonadota bacterium]MBK7785237.1 polysaccharide deacetylase family protein [Gemmatimonadota bacterium]MBK7923215.1 polysaccharide deacetylase family protein [Gemmatimonadota bacterium]MBK9066677.1 polysaccharide deacetylase family protein [Gemmatimonadota bacterium]